jgi:hypothetical protein
MRKTRTFTARSLAAIQALLDQSAGDHYSCRLLPCNKKRHGGMTVAD